MAHDKLPRDKQLDVSVTVVDGSRGFTAPVAGQTPTLPSHLAPKAYVDSVAGSVLSKADKDLTPLATVGDFAPTGIFITNTPPGGSWVGVFVNYFGPYVLGDGVKTTHCYFSLDGGVTALAIGSITAGAQLIWNGTTVKFDLDLKDRLALIY